MPSIQQKRECTKSPRVHASVARSMCHAMLLATGTFPKDGGWGGGGICAHLEHQIIGQTDEGENVFFHMALNNETAAHPCHRNLKLFLPY